MQVYKAIKYIRLSYTDDKTVESDSVANQRRLIDDYIARHPEIEVVAEKIDDGYSGVLFDRPAFQEMMRMIEQGEANCVIVKDLSRLGREYIETGRYMRRVFPAYGVRFIAINDNVDTENDAADDLTVSVKNIMNAKYIAPEIKFTEGNYRTVYDAIADIQDVIPVTEVTGDYIELEAHPNATGLEKELRGRALYNHITTATRETAMARFKALKAGENFHDLDPELKTTYSNADRTQNTIYMRLKYNEPSGTVVNVRKSMWIHPELDRAISIREAARLQTFPDTFIFEGTKDSQYQQVGNAVPPYLAKAIADSVISILNNATE